MSETTSSGKLEEDEQNPTDSIAEEGPTGQVRVLKKGKKKGKGKKRRETLESKDEEGDDEEDSSSRKKKGKKKGAPKTSVSSDIQPEVEATSETKQLEAAVTVDETPKETVIEIQGEDKRPEELEEIVVKKESTLIKGDNVVQEGDSGEGGGEEKKDVEREKIGEEETKEKEVVSEVEGATVRRRATLSDLRSESVDKGDGEQALSTAAGSEVRGSLKSCYMYVCIHL